MNVTIYIKYNTKSNWTPLRPHPAAVYGAIEFVISLRSCDLHLLYYSIALLFLILKYTITKVSYLMITLSIVREVIVFLSGINFAHKKKKKKKSRTAISMDDIVMKLFMLELRRYITFYIVISCSLEVQ